MDVAITVIQVLLIAGFAVGGLSQLLLPHSRYAQLPFQGWANDFKAWHVKLIGGLKLCAVAGIIASLFIPSLTMLMPLAAVGLALVMAGAMATHLRREEYVNIAGNLVYLGLWLYFAYDSLVTVAV